MKAAVTRSFGAPLVVEEVELDPPQSGEVRVRIGAVAVCGSDLHAHDGAWGGDLPTINGHEAAGTVVATGSDVDPAIVGRRVAVTLLRRCGACPYCVHDEAHLCQGEFALSHTSRIRDAEGRPVGQGIYVGAFAEEVVVHGSQVVPIPDEVPFDAGCLLACSVVTGYGAVIRTAGVRPGASVVVFGTGGVGAHCLQGAKSARASSVVAVDLDAGKLDLAPKLGATAAIPADDTDLASRIAEHVGEWGPDFVFVAVGNTAVIERGLDIVRPGGTLVVVGMTPAGSEFGVDASEFASSGRRILGSRMGSARPSQDIPALADLYLRGELVLDELVSGRYSLDEINTAVAATRTGHTLRNVITMDEERP